MSTKRLLIVAHPDDETLWFGGLLLRVPGDWTVIACSIPARDPIRGFKFFEACERLGARGRIIPITEHLDVPLTTLDEIDFFPFDLVVTHGAAGEYGHPAHKQVHEHVVAHCGGKVLASCYGSDAAPDVVIELTEQEWQRKQRALSSYSHLMRFGLVQMPTWQALLQEYGTRFDLKRETYVEM